MNILVITFELVGRDDAAYRHQATAIAPYFTRVPGLIGKLWLADPERSTYGGVYIFRDRAAVAGYLDSEVAQGLRANPNFANVTVRTFDTIAAASAITGGPLAALATLNGDGPAGGNGVPSYRLQAATSL
jgi:hypothetical protein